jgi:hypothetical protein
MQYNNVFKRHARRTVRERASKLSFALQLPQSTMFLSRLPWMVKMSPKYVWTEVPQLGHDACTPNGYTIVKKSQNEEKLHSGPQP